MSTAVTIPAQPPENKGLDYAYLRTEGVRLCQALSSSIWTDYNEHDPGVTTLEQLCYALTELSYRAELPVVDLLASRRTGDIHAHSHGLFSARRILPCNPVSVNDYRKLIVDRVPGVRNAWLTPLIPPPNSTAVNGLYEICVYSPNGHSRDEPCEEAGKIAGRVRRLYSRYRNLCEDVHSVRVLAPLRTVVHADVTIHGRQQPERTMAEILFAIGKVLAPELRRQPLSDLMTAGEAPDEIFNGPLLRDGFISDDQLQPKASSLPVNEITRALALTSGVAGVRHVAVRAGLHSKTYGPNDSIPVPADEYLHLYTHAREEEKASPIRLIRNGTVCTVDPDTVARELDLLWAGYRRGYPLEAQYREYFGIPRGEWRDLERYYSIQNQYPGIYGIGSYGLPSNASVKRRAQAKQLKGYLLPFEQLMSDYFAQLANVGNLFSINPKPWQTYYSQSLVKSVPDVQPVLSPGYNEGLDSIISGEDQTLVRRNHFLGYLLSLYANELYAERCNGDSLSQGDKGHEPTRSMERLLRARLEFLRVLVASTRTRGRGFDYHAKPSAQNIAGLEYKCRIEMQLDLERHQPFSEVLGKSDLKIARSTDESTLRRSEGRHSSHIDEHFLPVAAHPEPQDIPAESALLKGMSATEEFLDAAREINNLFVGKLPGDDGVTLACRSLAPGEWIIIDTFRDLETALREAHALWRHLQMLHRARTQLYIVEHSLLRSGRRKNRHNDKFAYSFTLTAVVGLPWHESTDRDDRTIVGEIVRENTPAHIVAEVCFLDPWNLATFEDLYWAWRGALHRRRGFAIMRTSARLRRFLWLHRRQTTTPEA